MSVKLDIYNAIVAAILADVTEIKTRGLWNNQFENESVEIPFNHPALLVEFTEIPWTATLQQPSRLGSTGAVQKEQKAAGTLITLHIGFWELDDETASFPIIDPIIEKVYFAIQGLDGIGYTPLIRISEVQDTDHAGVIDWQMTFSTMMQQAGEANANLTEIAGGTLDLEITKDMDIDTPVLRTGDGEV